MKIKKLILASALTLSVGLISACDEENTSTTTKVSYDDTEIRNEFLADANEVVINEKTVTFTDASGREEITINKNPKKVMNLYSSFTTLWYEAGGEVDYCIGGKSAIDLYKEYIGRDITKDEGVTVCASSGAGSKWSTEKLINYQPDLIICSTSMSGYSTISSPASAAEIPVIAVSYNDFSDYLKWFKVFSAITGHEDLYESVALNALNEVLDVIEECSYLEGPEVLSLFSGASSFSVNTEYTLVGSMIEILGGKNVASSWSNPTKTERLEINLETIYNANPAMILIQCHSDDKTVSDALKTLYGSNAVWNSIDAVKNEKIYFLTKTLYHNKPNSKFALAYQNLAKVLYPEHNFNF